MLLVLIIFVLMNISVEADNCPYNSHSLPNSTACVSIISDVANWQSAESICKYRGGHLLSLTSFQTTNYVVELLKKSHLTYDEFFLGGVYRNGQWIWTDGTPFTFSNFYSELYQNRIEYFNDVIATDSSMFFSYASETQFLTPREGYVLAFRGIDGEDGAGQWDIALPIDTSPFLCQIPKCSNTNLPMILDQNDNNTGLYYGEAGNRFYYGNLKNNQRISDGELACKSIGGHLPSITNAFLNSEVQNAAQAQLGLENFNFYYYIALGLTTMNGKNWHWLDGNNSTYTNWAPGEPQNSGKSYGTLYVTGSSRWSNIVDFEPTPYVCELPIPRLFC